MPITLDYLDIAAAAPNAVKRFITAVTLHGYTAHI
jgi:hypothetical protein